MIDTANLELHAGTGLRYRRDSMDLYLIGELAGYRELEPTSGDTILDVGACLGSVTSWARGAGARVIAVEPHPENFELLSLNAPHVTDNLHAACVADDRESIVLYVNRGVNGGLHSTTPHRGRDELIVSAVRFTELLRRYKVNKVKMDCEGAEYELLLARLPSSVKRLVIEYHLTKREWRENGPRLDEWLRKQGFAVMSRSPRFGDKNWTTFGTYQRP